MTQEADISCNGSSDDTKHDNDDGDDDIRWHSIDLLQQLFQAKQIKNTNINLFAIPPRSTF